MARISPFSRGSTLCATVLLTTAAHAAPPVPFATNAWGVDTGYYLYDGSAWWPEEMVTADFNGDGRLDVAITNWGNFLVTAPRVSVLFGTADGRFGAPMHYVTPSLSNGIDVGDLDGDGAPDLIVTDGGTWHTGTTITALYNDGSGRFDATQSFDVGATGPAAVRVADVTGDGHLDAITANHGDDETTISILAGDGTGTLGTPQLISTVNAPRTLAIGDIEGDGDLDIAVSGADFFATAPAIAILHNDGTGQFGAPQSVPIQTTSSLYRPALEFADMDADGALDLVYTDNGLRAEGGSTAPYAVAIHHGDGTGAFPTSTTHALGIYTGGLTSLAIDDFNDDGRLDVAGTHDANESWSILYGQPDGSLGAHEYLPAGEYPTDVLARDLDGDGTRELLVLAHFSQTIMVYDRSETGTFAHAPNVSLVYGGHYHFDVGDIDGDGDLDVAASNGYADVGGLSILRNSGDGTFGPFPITYVSPTYSTSVKLRDLNGDAQLDLLWADKYPPYSFRWRFNQGGGQFGPTQSSPDVFTCGVTLDDAINAWDFDGDGDLDPVLMENLGCAGGGDPKRLYLSENDGSGSMQLHTIIPLYLAPYEMMAGDVNEDGHLDLVVAHRAIEVFLGHGDLTFSAGTVYGSVSARHGVLVDLNGDGHLDVALAIPAQNDPRESLGVMLGAGDGSFGAMQPMPATRSPNLSVQTSIAAHDVDDDGDLDILFGQYASNSMCLFENNGDATFTTPVHISAMDNVREVAFADLTGDGRADALAMASFSTAGELGRDGIAILRGLESAMNVPGDVDGDGAVSFSDLITLLSTWGPCAACPADFNDDGAVDFADLLVVLSAWS